MEPNGYPSDDPGSFGCRKLLGLEDQEGEKGKERESKQNVLKGEGEGGLKRRDTQRHELGRRRRR